MTLYRASPTDGIAWITGGSSGIGRAVAKELAATGFTVCVTAREEDPIDALIGEAWPLPGRILSYPCDVTDEKRMAATVAAPLDEAAATNRLLQQLKRSAPYRVHGDCLSLLVEESEPAFFGIAVHEKHGDGCPGDPATAPVLDRFRVDVATGAMRRYDVVEDRYAEWAPDMAR